MILNIILILSIFANKQVLHVWFMYYLCPTVQLDMGVEEARLCFEEGGVQCTGTVQVGVQLMCTLCVAREQIRTVVSGQQRREDASWINLCYGTLS